MNRSKKRSRTECKNCLKLNEPRLDTCYYCGEVIRRGWIKSNVKRLKKMFSTLGNKRF